MSMREIMDVVGRSDPLREAKTYEVPVRSYHISGARQTGVTVYENPSKADMVGICQTHYAMSGDSNLRGFVHGGKVYVWGAEDATHTAMQRAMGFEADQSYEFYNAADVVNFHVRGYAWQDGVEDAAWNRVIVNGEQDKAVVARLARRWGCGVGEDGYY